MEQIHAEAENHLIAAKLTAQKGSLLLKPEKPVKASRRKKCS